MFILIYSLLIVALITDLASLILAVNRVIRGHGPSGIPVAPWLVYYLLTEWLNQSFVFETPLRAIIIFTVFHVLCQYFIPLIWRLCLKRRHFPAQNRQRTVQQD